MPALQAGGCTIGFLHQTNEPVANSLMRVPEGVPAWSLEELGLAVVTEAVRKWKPDLIYAHGALDAGFEESLLSVAPSVYFAHNYYGTCVGGAKTFRLPGVMACDRRFGWQCLALYFPRRCGGLNPVTMVQRYREESRRLERLHRYEAIITHSEHMRKEYVRCGISKDKVFSYGQESRPDVAELISLRDGLNVDIASKAPWKLLFAGRMDLLKGAHVLLDALPAVARSGNRPIEVTLIGDGPERQSLESRAAAVRSDGIDIRFTGWLQPMEVKNCMAGSDLLVVPSLWPEPFGKVGLEAGLQGVPAVGFAVGGIPDWLWGGVNGELAPGDPPRAEGLAAAIVRCLKDPLHYASLRANARRMAGLFAISKHCDSLMAIFRAIVSRGGSQ